MSRMHHFPKWLMEEHFEISHMPGPSACRFRVSLFRQRDRVYAKKFKGYGNSIANAAKAALKLREQEGR